MIEGVWEVKIDGSCWPEPLSFSDYGGQNMVRKPKNLKISKIVILSFGSILGYFWGLGVPQIIFFKNQDISNSGKTFSSLKITKSNQIGIWQNGISAVTDTHTDRQKLSNYRIDCKGWLWNWIRIFYYEGGGYYDYWGCLGGENRRFLLTQTP